MACSVLLFRTLGRRTLNRIEACALPVISAMHGCCIGGGTALGWVCDIRLAAENTVFRAGDAYLGMLPSWGMGLTRLPVYVGRNRALDILLIGENFDAKMPKSASLVTGTRMAIDSLLNPRSIAIVGASDKIGPGFNAWKALEHVGYAGRIYLVNPTKTELLGQKVYSGGEIALALDAAEASGIDFPPLGAAEGEIKLLLPEFSHLSNPLDLTWAGLYDPNVAQGCAQALGKMDHVGTLVLLQDAPTGLGPQQAARYTSLLEAVARGAKAVGKPLVALSNLSDEPHAELHRAAVAAGVPYLRGTREGLSAVARYARWATRRSPRVVSPTPAQTKAIARNRLHRFESGVWRWIA